MTAAGRARGRDAAGYARGRPGARSAGRLDAVTTLAELDELQSRAPRASGPRWPGPIRAWSRSSPADRPEAGRRLNEARRQIESHLAETPTPSSSATSARARLQPTGST